jgi:FG-GAP repeat
LRTILSCLLAVLVLALPAAAQIPDTLRHTLLPPPGAQRGAQLGTSVAVDGGYTVAGAPFDDVGATDSGVAKVFDSTTGALLFVLANPSPEANDRFGTSVAISGTRVVVGVPNDDAGATDAGSAYVYDLASGTPTVPVVTLNNPGPAAGDLFGYSVAISGTRVVVGAHQDDAGSTNAGTAYVFDISSATPASPVATLSNPSATLDDRFGFSVAISGTRIAVGAHLDDAGLMDAGSVYVYDLTSGTPAFPVATLNNPSPAAMDFFGYSVGISGTRVIVGTYGDDTGGSSSGNAYVYDIGGGTPTVPVATINNPSPSADDLFGWSVAISGTRAVVCADRDDTGASNAGSAYVYDISSGTPTVPVATLNNPSPAVSDRFGYSVAISGAQLVVGAFQDDTGADNAGSAYGYDLDNGTPAVPVATFNNPGPTSGNQFGSAVAISGTLMIVGSPYDYVGAFDAGVAYVYDLAGATPTAPAFTLTYPSPATGDQFGAAVAISGTRVVVGAPGDKTGTGIAYLYELGSGTPTAPVLTLNNPTPVTGDGFGTSAAIDGTRVVIGASGDDTGAPDAGSAYVYNIGSGTPGTPLLTLNNPAPAAQKEFGTSVAISGTRVVAGAPIDATATTYTGRAYVYDLASGSPAVPVFTLSKPVLTGQDLFGYSVAIDGARVVVGAPADSPLANDEGSAYAFEIAGGSPTVPVATLHNPNPGPEPFDNFGFSVAISGTRVVVGAGQDDTVADNAGSAYLYDLSSITPSAPVATLGNPGPAADDVFGFSVAIHGTTVAVGTPFDDTLIADKGAAYIYGPDSTLPTGGTMTLTPASPVDAGAALTVDFAGWTDASLPLGYTVLIDDVIVSPAGPTVSRTITGPTASGAHILKGRIADAAGNVTEVMQNFTVLTPLESWRRLHFGIITDTGDAADTADPDGDGDENRFEYAAGLIPTDPISRFRLRVEPAPGPPGQVAIIFSPRFTDRTYVVRSKASLADPDWTPLTSSSTTDDGDERTVIDLLATPAQKFYQVEITRP